MDMKIATVSTREEYAPFVWDKVKGGYTYLFQQRSIKPEWAMNNFQEYRKTWERNHPEFDFDNVEIRHRTIVTTTSAWETV